MNTTEDDGLLIFEWVVPESERFAAIRAIEEAGGSVEESDRPMDEDSEDDSAAGFEPLLIIVAVMAVIRIVRQLQRLWDDLKRKGGVIVDVRGGKVRVRVVESLDREMTIVVSDGGTSVHRPADGASLGRLVRAALPNHDV
jgi:hypothetical protein